VGWLEETGGSCGTEGALSGWIIEGPGRPDPGAYRCVRFGDAQVMDVNDDGLMAVRLLDSGMTFSYAFDGTTWVELVPPGAAEGTVEVTRVNNRGQFAGSYLGEGGEHGFIATPVTAAAVAQR
jgi:hypothetical protein